MTTEKVCHKKKRYPSKKEANKIARRLLRKGRRLGCYRCDLCEGYHLTHKKKMAYTIKARENNHPD